VETLASQDELDLVAEELRKRCTASEAATIQRLRELSNAIAAGGGGGGGGGNIGSGGGAYADEDVPAGFRSPVRCISCNRPKSPGGRNSSPPREIRGDDGRLYGNMDRAGEQAARRRPNSAVSRASNSAAALQKRPGSAGMRRSAETIEIQPMSEAQILEQYGIDPNPPGGNNTGYGEAIKVPVGGNYAGTPSPGINVGGKR